MVEVVSGMTMMMVVESTSSYVLSSHHVQTLLVSCPFSSILSLFACFSFGTSVVHFLTCSPILMHT